MVEILSDNQQPSIVHSRTALQELSPNKSNAIRRPYDGLKGRTLTPSISSPATNNHKISKYPSGSGSPFSISAYQTSNKSRINSESASLPWSRRSTSIIASTTSFTVFPEETPRNSFNSGGYKNAVSALRSLSRMSSTDDDRSDHSNAIEPINHTSPSVYSNSCRDHAGKLRTRLRLAYYKVLTNQTALSLSQMALVQKQKQEQMIYSPQSVSITPMKRKLNNSQDMRTPPVSDRYLAPSSSTKGTPSSMGAAKSLLRLGTF